MRKLDCCLINFNIGAIMKKISLICIVLFGFFSSSLFADSAKWGLKKPSTHVPLEFNREVNNVDQALSVSVGFLTNSGDLSAYESGMSIDFLLKCKKSCTIMGQNLDLGVGASFMPMCSDSDAAPLSLASMALHVMPQLNLPVSFNFGTGIGHAPGPNDGMGSYGFISMDLFYKLPFCNNMSLGLQYKNIIEPVDGEVTFSRLSNMGLALRIDG